MHAANNSFIGIEGTKEKPHDAYFREMPLAVAVLKNCKYRVCV